MLRRRDKSETTPDDALDELTEDQLIVEIAAMLEERHSLERELAEGERAYREASEAWSACSERHDVFEARMAAARSELRRRMLG